MFLRKFIVFIVCGVFISPVLADSILLKDGTRINGMIQSLNHGTYTIKSIHLGELKIPQQQIVSISSAESNSSHKSESLLATLQESITKDPKTVDMIHELKNNPNVTAILDDPKIMKAISAGDFQSLLASPKIQKLINDPQMKDITNRIK